MPVDATSFVGRWREAPRARGYLSHSRLLTLTGVGGVGKSRLALRVAGTLRHPPPDGVWTVDVSGVGSGELLAQAVADAMGLCQRAAEPVTALLDHLRDRQLLLVLDNCEQMRGPCAVLVERLLAAAPGVRVLATSRQPLGVPGERLYVVPALSVPEPDHPVPADLLTRYDAVSLFAQRAADIRADFRVGAENRELVIRLCRQLDGVPLAIELAAARLRTLSLEQLVARLGDYFGLLAIDGPAGASRQRTLRATMDWSFDLCSPVERAVWARLSVFSGGVDLAAAEAVCAGEGITREDVDDAVLGLVDKSVLAREEIAGSVRYRLLATVREYGRQRLAAAGEEPTLRRRHRDWYRDLAAASARAWTTDAELGWLARLRAEHANLRCALEYCLTVPGEAEAGLAIGASLADYWYATGHLAEGRHWLGRALAVTRRPTATRARALWADGWCGLLQGDTDTALPLVRECETLATRLRDEAMVAYAKLDRAIAELNQQRPDRASSLLGEALPRLRSAGDSHGVWLTLYLRVLAESVRGDVDRAAASGEECVALSEARGAGWSRSQGLWALGVLRCRQGEWARAAALARDSLRQKWPLRDRWGMTLCLELLAWAAAGAGQADRAARLLGAGHAWWRAVGSSPAVLGALADSHRHCVEDTRRLLGEHEFTTAFREGGGFATDDAIAYALQAG
ncbi:LuxR family transcriptional regulator [Gandjariella thermophila]|uniref:LuxR family transcriptional regulator n=1 Tax=Gandjariella thermophila TaxID=1931992 RepID=A0A4D4IZP1_9PSEU|nr:LuxR family transcriptional regulator [Gandjariella thermophila]